MNINTREETIKFTATEENWLLSIKALAANVGCQSFVNDKVTAACDSLGEAIDKFNEAVQTLAPKKKAKATA